jgi:hypothetical protein
MDCDVIDANRRALLRRGALSFLLAAIPMNAEAASRTTASLTKGRVHFAATLEQDSARCVIAYTVTVSGEAPVYVLDGLPGPSTAQPPYDPGLAWVGWREPESAVILRGTPPPPKLTDVLVAIVPLAHRVDPGTPWTSSVHLSLPLVESNPYFPLRQNVQFQTAFLKQLVLELEYIAELDNVGAEPVPGLPGLFSIVKSRPGGGLLPFERAALVLQAGALIALQRRTEPGFEAI